MAKKEPIFLMVEAGQTGLSTRKLILESAGYNVLSADTASDALQLSAAHATDAVLFDIDVHDMAPAEFIHALKQQRRERPVFLLASRPWPPDDLRGLVDGVFDKMEDPQEMLSSLRHHFNNGDGKSA